jgi:hypothetical protein
MDKDVPIPNVDPVLAALVAVVNHSAGEMTMTFLVGGTWISGMLVSPRVWTTEVAEVIRRVTGADQNYFSVMMDVVGREWFPSDSEREARGDDEPDDPYVVAHAHLRGGRSVTSDDQVPTGGTYLRVRLEHVEAWSVGSFGHDDDQPPKAPMIER